MYEDNEDVKKVSKMVSVQVQLLPNMLMLLQFIQYIMPFSFHINGTLRLQWMK
jgi:hypothetical protein